MIEHTASMFVADKRINQFMNHFDLQPNGKWFCRIEYVSFKTATQVTEEYFRKMIDESKFKIHELGFWIPAIHYMDNFFAHPEVKIVSDGQREYFISVQR